MNKRLLLIISILLSCAALGAVNSSAVARIGSDLAATVSNVFFPVLRDLESDVVILPPGQNDTTLLMVPAGQSFVLTKIWCGLPRPYTSTSSDHAVWVSVRRAGTAQVTRLKQLEWSDTYKQGRDEFDLQFKLRSGDELIAQTTGNYLGLNTVGWSGVAVRP